MAPSSSLLFTLCRRLSISFAALLTSLILVNPQGNPCAESSAASGTVGSDIINGLGAGEVRVGGNPSLSPRMATGAVPVSFASASVPLLKYRSICLLTQSQASYRSTSVHPSARRLSSCFHADNEEATDNDDDGDADDGDFPDTLGEILGAPWIASPVLDLELTFGATDSNVDFDRTTLLSALSPLPPLLASLPSSSAAGEPNLRSRSFHYHNHLFPLLVAVL